MNEESEDNDTEETKETLHEQFARIGEALARLLRLGFIEFLASQAARILMRQGHRARALSTALRQWRRARLRTEASGTAPSGQVLSRSPNLILVGGFGQ